MTTTSDRPAPNYPNISPCPTWCLGPPEHAQAVAEGCDEADLYHLSPDLGFRVDTLTNPNDPTQVLRHSPGSLRLQLMQDAATFPFGGFPVIELEVSSGKPRGFPGRQEARLRLTSGEARSLAAMLVHFADREDLHHWC